jgi:hypothetical protein
MTFVPRTATPYSRLADDLGRGDVSRNAHHEEMSDALVEHELDRHPGIGARQHRSERLLLFGCLGLENRQVLVE